jgi:putative tryptophan/tyrosine transport system substrate-binding protein
MRRREFITLLGATAVAWPLGTRAQQRDQVRRIAVLMDGAESDTTLQALIYALREGLRNLGWIEGGNIRIEDRWAAGDTGRMRKHAAELVAMPADVILTGNTPIVQELQRQTRTIPIVFVALGDPVATGVVASLARPGGNATGFMNPQPSISGKWLELLKEVAPGVNRVLVMVNAGNVANATRLRAIEHSAPSLGVQVSSSAVRDADDIESAIETIARESNTGLIVVPGAPISDHRKMIFALAVRNRLPAVYPYRYYVTEGGLMSYGSEPLDMWQRVASYVDRVLKGEKPADLPVQEPTVYRLVVNLRTAKAIGLSIPEAFLLRANEVIE